MKYVTLRNQGNVLIASGKAELVARNQDGLTDVKARVIREGTYPGTLVKVILRTDTFDALAADVEPEAFSW